MDSLAPPPPQQVYYVYAYSNRYIQLHTVHYDCGNKKKQKTLC
jgi:hypothetical protein